MNLIAKLLPLSNVVLDLDVSSKKRLFEQAGLLFENNQGVARSVVFDSLFAREKSLRFFSVVVPVCVQTVAFFSCLADLMPDLTGTIKPCPS